MGWTARAAEAKTVHTDEFREGLGRLGFAAGPLPFVRPFLGPLYSWIALVRPGARVAPPR